MAGTQLRPLKHDWHVTMMAFSFQEFYFRAAGSLCSSWAETWRSLEKDRLKSKMKQLCGSGKIENISSTKSPGASSPGIPAWNICSKFSALVHIPVGNSDSHRSNCNSSQLLWQIYRFKADYLPTLWSDT